jgi:hypothetical protein
MSTTQPNRDGDITLVIGPKQTEHLRRLLLDDVADQAENLAPQARDAAQQIDNAMNIEDARTALRLMGESIELLDMLGWAS